MMNMMTFSTMLNLRKSRRVATLLILSMTCSTATTTKAKRRIWSRWMKWMRKSFTQVKMISTNKKWMWVFLTMSTRPITSFKLMTMKPKDPRNSKCMIRVYPRKCSSSRRIRTQQSETVQINVPISLPNLEAKIDHQREKLRAQTCLGYRKLQLLLPASKGRKTVR